MILEAIINPLHPLYFLIFFFNDTATTEIYTLSLHDALPIYADQTGAEQHAQLGPVELPFGSDGRGGEGRSEEHTSELQSRPHLVCRLLLEKKKKLEAHFHREVELCVSCSTS